jgi:hypothetical protein
MHKPKARRLKSLTVLLSFATRTIHRPDQTIEDSRITAVKRVA